MTKHSNSPADESAVAERPEGTNFIRTIINEDLARGTNGDRVATRFPPEPNGYLHIGHAASICLNFGIGEDYNGGVCHLRFDDTNPATEEVEYVESIQHDIKWLGFDWGPHLYFASDYFEELYEMAVGLIKQGKAFVDSSSEEEIREYRGTVTEPGKNSRYRDRSVEENLDLFARMRTGEFPDGAHVLRAKIDMASNNMLMRDPVLYRIKHAHHYRTGDDWFIYPLYDYAHPLSDAIEGITHSICTMEFEVHRELYDWLVENVDREWAPRPRQYEFARRNLEYTIVSKRKLLKLVNDDHVDGWDDPRMPTIAGLRRRGYTPEAIRAYCERIGVAKADNRVDMALLEFSIRDDLNHRAPRVMGVLRPLKVVLTNYPEGEVEEMEAPYWPHDVPKEGSRAVPFSRELYIEESDFSEDPPKGFFRLSPGGEVRLRYGYIIKCDEVVKDDSGKIVELLCSYDPETKSGGANADRRVKGTIHWVSAAHAVPAEVRLYDRLFKDPNPEVVEEGKSFLDNLNPDSCEIISTAMLEASMASAKPGERFQFERQGYFILDKATSTAEKPVYNRIVTLRDTWKKKVKARATTPSYKNEGVDGTGIVTPRGSKAKGKTPTTTFKPNTTATSHNAPRTRETVREGLDAAHHAAFDRYLDELHLGLEEAEVLAGDAEMAKLFEDGLAHGANPKAMAGWLVSVIAGELNHSDRTWSSLLFGGAELAELVGLIDDKTISTRLAKDVLGHMMEHGGSPAAIVDEKGLRQVTDESEVAAFVDQVIEQFPDKVMAFKDGKTGLIGFFVGQVMRISGGKANPQLVQKTLQSRLNG